MSLGEFIVSLNIFDFNLNCIKLIWRHAVDNLFTFFYGTLQKNTLLTQRIFMNFKEYVAHVKATHHQEPEKVIAGFKDNLSLMETEADVMTMTELIVHVCAQMGEWEKGIELLRKIKNNAKINDKSSMNRFVAILDLGNNPNFSLEKFSSSDQVQIYAPVSAALVGLGGFKNADKLLMKASELAETLPVDDPAIKILSYLSGYMAKTLEAKTDMNEAGNMLLLKTQDVVKKLSK